MELLYGTATSNPNLKWSIMYRSIAAFSFGEVSRTIFYVARIVPSQFSWGVWTWLFSPTAHEKLTTTNVVTHETGDWIKESPHHLWSSECAQMCDVMYVPHVFFSPGNEADSLRMSCYLFLPGKLAVRPWTVMKVGRRYGDTVLLKRSPFRGHVDFRLEVLFVAMSFS